MNWRGRSRPDALDLAVVGLSARALARSARRAGLRALSLDLFADADTREHAALAVRATQSRRGQGFDGAALLASLADHAPEGLPVVLGAGFEHTPRLMRAIARRNPILGATPEAVARLKDPFGFAALLRDLDVPHPAVRGASAVPPPPSGEGSGVGVAPDGTHPSPRPYALPPRIVLNHPHAYPPRKQEGSFAVEPVWLSKRRGASGGAHIREWSAQGGRRYLQQRLFGRPISALFLADGTRTQLVGFSEQWPDPAPRAPYRYGGAVGPVTLAPIVADAVARAIDRIVAATGLTGLASADLIVDDDAWSLLEINPRPGATLDVFDRGETPSLLGLHLDACAGRLPTALPGPGAVHAAAIVYADRAIRPAALPRPVWTADWPSCDETIRAGAPFCTAFASGPSPSAARSLLERRRIELLTAVRAAEAPAPTKTKKAHA